MDQDSAGQVPGSRVLGKLAAMPHRAFHGSVELHGAWSRMHRAPIPNKGTKRTKDPFPCYTANRGFRQGEGTGPAKKPQQMASGIPPARREPKLTTMKTSTILLSLAAAGAGVLLTSCADPYYTGATATTTVTTHRPGYVVHTLPPGYRTQVISGTQYYSHNNVYYRPQGREYVVVDAPHRQGRDRDRDHRNDRGWDGRPDRGPDRDRYDRDHDRGGRGNRDVTVIRELPRGYKVINRSGQRYYQAGNVYYQSRGDGYIVVRSPY